MKDRRSLELIYYLFLEAVILNKAHTPSGKELKTSGLTRIQRICNLAYDRTRHHKANLIKYGLLTDQPLAATQRGFEFYKIMTMIEYNRKLIEESYLTTSTEMPNIELMTIPPIGGQPIIIPAKELEFQMKEFQQVRNAMAATIEALEEKKVKT